MNIIIHEHAKARMIERGVAEHEVLEVINHGEQFTAKYNRIGYRRNCRFDSMWRGKFYHTKQVEIYTVRENDTVVVISVIAKYF